MGYQEFTIEGRNAVIEAYRAGKPIDKLFILDGCQDGPMMTIKREAKKHDTLVKYVTKERLDQLSETGKHQGVIAYAAAYEYAEVDDILEGARKKGEPPFIFLLDNIEDPHNLGAIIRTANLAGAHGVIIPKNRAAGLTATVARTSAGALNYTPVAKVTNLAKTIEELKKEGLWFVCADMGMMDRTSPDVIKEVERVLEKKLSSLVNQDYTIVGGVDAIVNILNTVDRTTEKHIMESLEIEEPELADEIRKKMFVFEDILLLDDRAIQRVLRDVDNADLGVALKAANEEVQNVIFKNLSKRLAAMIKEDMEFMGPVRMKDVEEAQQKVVSVIRKLEDSGEIVISRGGGDEIVV